MKKILAIILTAVFLLTFATACGSGKEKIVIYSSAEDYREEWLREQLTTKFPEYDISIEHYKSGDHGARLLAEGVNSNCDITYDLEYASAEKIKNSLADLTEFDSSEYLEDLVSDTFFPEYRNGGSIIVNTKVLEERNLPEPTCYDDLLKAEYKGLISMPSPKSSGTGYIFLKNMVNVRGEDAAFKYFDELSKNILQYTGSGSGPVSALVAKEAAVGLGITGDAVKQINDGEPLKVLFFEEGSPFSMYGFGIIKGKETRESVKKVFEYINSEIIRGNNELFYPEQIFKDKAGSVPNYPQNIEYADMSNNTPAEKDRLLEKWTH